MRDLRESCRIAVVQAAPVMFDKAACTVKAVELIRAAAAEQAELIVFPELFIPGYPYGMTFGFTVGSRTAPGRKDWGLYYDNSILVPGPETEILGRAAREARAYVSIGVSERDAVNATLYNTNLIFSPAGELLTVHRKLKPTGAERVVWGDADRHYFPVAQTPWGPMASLICWESYMPLARVALYEKGDHPVPLSQHQRQRGVAGHHPSHCHRGALLFRQLRHGLHSGHVPRRAPLPGGDRPPAGYRLPGRQLRGGSLRPLCDPARLGPGGHHLCGSGPDPGAPEPDGIRRLRPLRPAGRAEAGRGRPVTEMPKEEAPL